MAPAANRESSGIRTFICIEIPDRIRRRISDLQAVLRPAGRVSWIKPANIHLTIKFLGDVRTSELDRVREAVARAAADVAPFEIEVGGVGCFPGERNPRVLWVGLTSVPEQLVVLHAGIEAGLSLARFPPDQKRFSPHLTIGRIREPRQSPGLIAEMTKAGFEPVQFSVTDVIVMRSVLNRAGSIYTPLASIPLSDQAV